MYHYRLEFMEFDKNDTPKMRREKEHSRAYAITRAMLKVVFKIEDPTIFFNENGKPYIKREGVYFSISHSNGLIAIIVADSVVGIDCELIKERTREEMEKFALRFFTESEIKQFIKTDFDIKEFYKIWTAKEATLKKHGLNMSYLSKIDTTKENLMYVEKNGYIICINI